MVSREDGFSWVQPRISRDDFVQALYGTPAGGEDTGTMYDTLNQYHVDPLFALGIFYCESRLATDRASVNIRYDNHNPGNIRNPPPKGDTVDTDRGSFLDFQTWTDGFNAMGVHLDSALYRGMTISDAIYKWAPPADHNDPEAYIARLLDYMNNHRSGENGATTMPRVILQVGHENIGSLTDDRLGVGDADRLRRATGSLGTENVPNGEVARQAAELLRSAGVDVVVTDAVWHPDIYNTDADLWVAIHHDGVGFGNDHPQHSGAAVVKPEQTAPDAVNVAESFVTAWKRISPEVTGITDTSVDTNDMDEYYGGSYPTRNTPKVIVECSVWGGSDGQRPDVNTATEGTAIARATLVALGMDDATVSSGGVGNNGTGTSDQPADGRTDEVAFGTGYTAREYVSTGDNRGVRISYPGNDTGYWIGHGIYDDWIGTGPTTDKLTTYRLEKAVQENGLPLSDEYTHVGPDTDGIPVTQQIFERTVYRWVRDADGSHGHMEKLALGRLYRDTYPNMMPASVYRG